MKIYFIYTEHLFSPLWSLNFVFCKRWHSAVYCTYFLVNNNENHLQEQSLLRITVCSKAVLSTCCFPEMFALSHGFGLSHIVTERHVFLEFITRPQVNHIFSFYLFFFPHLKAHFCLEWSIPRNSSVKYVLWFLYQAPDGLHNTCLKVSKSTPYIQVTLEFSFSFLGSPRLMVEVFSPFLYFHHHS